MIKERKRNYLLDIESANVAETKFKNIKKNAFLPSIIGFVGGGVGLYAASRYGVIDLNLLHLEGFWKSVLSDLTFNGDIVLSNGKELDAAAAQQYFYGKMKENWVGVTLSFVATFALTGLSWWFTKNYIDIMVSKNKLEDQFIRGNLLVMEKEYLEEMKRRGVEGLEIGDQGAAIDIKTEQTHAVIIGKSRVGKSFLLKNILTQLLKDRPNPRIVLLDPKGELIQVFYQEGRDIILSYGDERSKYLNTLDMIDIDYENKTFSMEHIQKIVEIVITRPKDEKDPVWTNNPRIVLKAVYLYIVQKLMIEKKLKITDQDIADLVILSAKDLINLLKQVKGTEQAIKLLSTGSQDQIGNFMSAFVTSCSYYVDLPKHNIEFIDIKKFLVGKGSGIVFLSNGADAGEDIYNKRVQLFLEMVIKSLKSLGVDPHEGEDPREGNRRTLYMLLDEFGDIPKMDSFIHFIAKASGYGGSAYMFFQEISRLQDTWGKPLVSTILNNCETQIIYKQVEPESKKFCSELIGEMEKESTSAGASSGTEIEAARAGNNYNTQDKMSKLVMPEEIGNLPKFHFYMKNGDMPWLRVKSEWKKERDFYENINEPFLRETLTESQMWGEDRDKILKLIANFSSEEEEEGEEGSSNSLSQEEMEDMANEDYEAVVGKKESTGKDWL